MRGTDEELPEVKTYECLDCGRRVAFHSHPLKCADCGGLFHERKRPTKFGDPLVR